MTVPETPLPDRLAAALRTGTTLDLSPGTSAGELIEESEMHDWDTTHNVEAVVVRAALLGRLVDDPDPRGLRLRGARIQGPLDLNHLDTTISLYLYDCLIEAGVYAQMAHLRALVITRCRIGSLDRPAAVVADHLHTDGPLVFDGSVITAAHPQGAVCLHGAQVDGQLILVGAAVRNAQGPAVTAENLQAGGNAALCQGFVAEGIGPRGAVCLLGAHVRGQLNLNGAALHNPTGPALLAEGLQTGQSLFLLEGFVAVGEGDRSALRLTSARIGGQLALTGAAIRNPTGPGIRADHAQVDGDVWMNGGFSAEGSGDAGAVSLDSARVSGTLSLGGAAVRNASGPAVMADDLHTGGGLFLNEDFQAEGSGRDGAVRLLGAQVDGQVHLGHAYIVNFTGPAVVADGLQTGGSLCFEDGFVAAGVGEAGAVRIVDCRVSSQVQFGRAQVHNANGPALVAQSIQAQGQVIFHQGFAADGVTPGGAVELTGAKIGGPLRFGYTGFSNLSGAALNADRMDVGADLTLGKAFFARGGGTRATVNLSGTRVGGQLTLDGLEDARVSSRSGIEYRWEIDGLSYIGVPQPSDRSARKAWLDLLARKTARYSAQPYQRLAAAYRAEGHDSDVRAILMAQRRDQIARGGLGWMDRGWGRTTGVLLGYGYQPWRALLLLLGIVAASVGLAVILGAHGGLIETPGQSLSGPRIDAEPATAASQRPTPAKPCTRLEVAQRGLDIGMPFLPHAASTCATSDSATGVALTISTWVLRLAAWAAGTLFIAGFTGIVRKT